MVNTIFIVDDDPVQRRILQHVVSKDNYKVETAEGGPEAWAMLQDPTFRPDVMILDLMMPQMDGFTLLDKMTEMGIVIPTIVQTAQSGIDTIVKAMSKGAKDFMVKPASPERVLISIKNALENNNLQKEIKRITKKTQGKFTFGDMIASSPAMDRVKMLGNKGAQSNIPILIEGESGVGKEVVARAIQGTSMRSGKPFITVNCGAIPENLVESILFGHEKGSFTGATGKQMGKFAEANGGTLFLDEVGELPLNIQVKLLRAIQEGEIEPVGAAKTTKVDIRFISATNKDMIEAVKTGEFREDLYYRLNVFPILIPPLRERLDDIGNLAVHFITRFAIEEGKNIEGMTPQALQMMMQYNWPGNVRQLENTIFRAVILCETTQLDICDFPQITAHIDGYDNLTPPAPAPQTIEPKIHQGPAMLVGDETPLERPKFSNTLNGMPNMHIPNFVPNNPHQNMRHQSQQPTRIISQNSIHQTAEVSTSDIPAIQQNGEMRRLEEVEADMIRMAMNRYRGHMSEVARKLGIGRSTLYRKVNDLGLQQAED